EKPDWWRAGPGDVGIEMPYRLWIGESEIEQLEQIPKFIAELSRIIESESIKPERYYEFTQFGTQNWTTFLELFSEQVRLSLLTRDYLQGLLDGRTPEELAGIASAVRRQVARVESVGDAARHVD